MAKPEERALTDEQIKEKMKKFKIDDSRVKVNNEVRIRYAGSKDKKSKTDARMQNGDEPFNSITLNKGAIMPITNLLATFHDK